MWTPVNFFAVSACQLQEVVVVSDHKARLYAGRVTKVEDNGFWLNNGWTSMFVDFSKPYRMVRLPAYELPVVPGVSQQPPLFTGN